jgi:hypothetical protein
VLREERGFLAGALLAPWQRQRRGEVLRPLTAPRRATQAARHLAARADRCASHPSRAAPRLALGRGVEPRGAKGAGPLHAWVMRGWQQTHKRPAPIGLVTTALRLSARWPVRPYEERPEIAQDYAQLPRGGWQRQPRRSTRSSEIVFEVLPGGLRDRLDHVFPNPQAGSRCANKPRQAMAFEPRRPQRTQLIGYAGGSLAIVDTLHFVQMVVPLSPPGPEQRRTWLGEHLNQMQKRE